MYLQTSNPRHQRVHTDTILAKKVDHGVEQAHTDSNCNSVVLEVQNSRECLVSITHNGVLKFENSKLRPHQDWLDGNWVMSSKKSSELVKKFGDLMPKTKNVTGIKVVLMNKPNVSSKKPRNVIARTTNTQSKFVAYLCKDEKVEFKTDEEGYQLEEHCHLRPHQEWIDGKWVVASSV
ncbi:hypothetical protein GmHk_15G043639 [Glycine max]|nr:hypothetical protein GmHk_15G043639 [Glycine max]